MLTALSLALAVVLLVYHHVGYPILLEHIAKRCRAQRQAHDPLDQPCPSVCIIVPAYNEADVIAAKVHNLCELDYPQDNLRVVLALDGCTDESEPIVRETLAACSPKFLFEIKVYARNIGKVAVLNDQISLCSAEIVALSDASALVGPDALSRAAVHFRDPNVGVVCGTYQMTAGGHAGEAAYWRYQTIVKALEARVAAPIGAHGAFYAIRRALWSPLPADTINDDFVIPMRIVAQGRRAVYDVGIEAREIERSRGGHNFWRRVRIGSGNLQQAMWLMRLGDLRRGRLAFLFLSGKGLRALVPFLLLVVVVCTLSLLSSNPTALLGVLLLVAALGGLAIVESEWTPFRLPRSLRSIAYVVQGYVALALGSSLWLMGLKQAPWRVSSAAKSAVGERGIQASRSVSPRQPSTLEPRRRHS